MSQNDIKILPTDQLKSMAIVLPKGNTFRRELVRELLIRSKKAIRKGDFDIDYNSPSYQDDLAKAMIIVNEAIGEGILDPEQVDLLKGQAAAEGEERTWGGRKYKKSGGQWVFVKTGEGKEKDPKATAAYHQSKAKEYSHRAEYNARDEKHAEELRSKAKFHQNKADKASGDKDKSAKGHTFLGKDRGSNEYYYKDEKGKIKSYSKNEAKEQLGHEPSKDDKLPSGKKLGSSQHELIHSDGNRHLVKTSDGVVEYSSSEMKELYGYDGKDDNEQKSKSTHTPEQLAKHAENTSSDQLKKMSNHKNPSISDAAKRELEKRESDTVGKQKQKEQDSKGDQDFHHHRMMAAYHDAHVDKVDEMIEGVHSLPDTKGFDKKKLVSDLEKKREFHQKEGDKLLDKARQLHNKERHGEWNETAPSKSNALKYGSDALKKKK